MSLFKKQWFAITIMVLCGLSAIAIGYWKHDKEVSEGVATIRDSELDKSLSLDYNTINDKEELLSASTEDIIKLYNANWDKKYGSVISIETVKKTKNYSYSQFAANEASKLGLGKSDGMLLLIKKDKDFIFVANDDFPIELTDDKIAEISNAIIPNMKKDYDAGVLLAYGLFNDYFKEASLKEPKPAEEKEEAPVAKEDEPEDGKYDSLMGTITDIIETVTDTKIVDKTSVYFSGKASYLENLSLGNTEVSKNDGGFDINIPKIHLSKGKIILIVIILLFIFSGKKKH